MLWREKSDHGYMYSNITLVELELREINIFYRLANYITLFYLKLQNTDHLQ